MLNFSALPRFILSSLSVGLCISTTCYAQEQPTQPTQTIPTTTDELAARQPPSSPPMEMERPYTGGPVPFGTRIVSRRDSGWMVSGATIFTTAYIPAFVTGLFGLGYQQVDCATVLLASGNTTERCIENPLRPMPLFLIPIIGPAIGGALIRTETNTDTALIFGAIDTAFQSLGLLFFLIGLPQRQWIVPNECYANCREVRPHIGLHTTPNSVYFGLTLESF